VYMYLPNKITFFSFLLFFFFSERYHMSLIWSTVLNFFISACGECFRAHAEEADVDWDEATATTRSELVFGIVNIVTFDAITTARGIYMMLVFGYDVQGIVLTVVGGLLFLFDMKSVLCDLREGALNNTGADAEKGAPAKSKDSSSSSNAGASTGASFAALCSSCCEICATAAANSQQGAVPAYGGPGGGGNGVGTMQSPFGRQTIAMPYNATMQRA
jgi:hypothetical protein